MENQLSYETQPETIVRPESDTSAGVEDLHPKVKPAEPDVFVIRRETFNYIIIAVTFLLVGVALGWLVFGANRAAVIDETALSNLVQESVVNALDSYVSADRGLNPDQTYEVTSDAEDPSLGPANALVTMVEFSDFRCTFCDKFANETLPLLMKNYGDRVRFVYRDYPQFGELSVQAAMGAQCANDQGRFWDYHNILFKNQKALTDVAVYTRFAQELGLDMAAFNDCMTTQKYAQEIAVDFQDGQKYGRIGTPTFFVNGKPIIGAQPYEEFARVLDEQLAVAQAAGS